MRNLPKNQTITLAWTGASGGPYGLRLLQCLLAADYQVYLLISSAARVVLATEQGLKLSASPEKAHQALVDYLQCAPEKLVVCGKEDWFSPVASGSAAPKQMVVCPCSVGSMAAIAYGMSDNLITTSAARSIKLSDIPYAIAADVVIKERGQLLLVVRETPFSTIHLENMLKLSQAGATIMPAAPGFYHQPQSVEDMVDFMVGRILDHLGIEQTIVPRWGYRHHIVKAPSEN